MKSMTLLVLSRVVLLGAIVAASVGCGADSSTTSDDGKLDVAVGIAPIAWLVRQVGGEHVRVDLLLPANQDPHSYSPPAKQVASLTKVDVAVFLGLPFETALLDRLQGQLDNVEVVMARDGMTLIDMVGHHHHEHDAHEEHEHADETKDPHVWLSVHNVKLAAETIAQTLTKLDPDHAADYQKNLADCLARLDAANDQATALLAPHRGQRVYVFHPAYGYFLADHHLHQQAIEIEGKAPASKELVETLRAAHADGARAIFAQQKDVDHARAVAEDLGVRLILIDPLAEDLPGNLVTMAREIDAALPAAGPEANETTHEHEENDDGHHDHD